MTTATRLTKSFAVVETKVLDADMGLVECAFSVTGNVDRQNDRILPGAFKTALASSRPPTVVYSHVWDDIHQVLGKTQTWNELLPGDPSLPSKLKAQNEAILKAGKGEQLRGCMKAQVKFDRDTPSGALAFTHVKNENLVEWSFAFDVADGGTFYDDPGKSLDGGYVQPVRNIKDISEVFEVSLVLIGANPATSTVGWKSILKEAKSDLGAIVEAYEAWKQAPDADSFNYYEAAKDAIAAVLLGEAPLSPPAADILTTADPLAVEPIEVTAEVITESVPAWMQAGILEALRPATDTVPDNAKPEDVAGSLVLLPPLSDARVLGARVLG